MEEMTAKVKLENSPLIKSLLFSDKKPNTHFMILAEANTKPEKGKACLIQPFGRKLGPLIITFGCPRSKFCKKC